MQPHLQIGISFRRDLSCIEARVPKELSRKIDDMQLSVFLFEEFQFQTFHSLVGPGKFYGFNAAAVKSSGPKMIKLLFPLSHAEIPCACCQGLGLASCGGKCCSCLGSGKKRDHKMERAAAISATLAILMQYANCPQKDHPSMIDLVPVAANEMGGCGISGKISPKFCSYLRYLSRHPQKRKEALLTAAKGMEQAHRCFYQQIDDDFIVEISPNKLVLSCPGCSCKVYAKGNPSKEGLPIESHNVDLPTQQISLFVGLLILKDLALRDSALY